MNNEKYSVIGIGWHWEDIVFFHHQSFAVYKGNIYSIDPLVAELLVIKMEIRNLRTMDKVIDRINSGANYKRYDTCIEWEDLFFDYGECEVVYKEKVYFIEDKVADKLYYLFREIDFTRLPFILGE